jgi:hypothetical protein
MLQRAGRTPPPAEEEPGVDIPLDVNAEYRARAGSQPKVAPRRFNPKREAWLPILHTEPGPWQFTVLFSNTARARARPHRGLGAHLSRRRPALPACLPGDGREQQPGSSGRPSFNGDEQRPMAIGGPKPRRTPLLRILAGGRAELCCPRQQTAWRASFSDKPRTFLGKLIQIKDCMADGAYSDPVAAGMRAMGRIKA